MASTSDIVKDEQNRELYKALIHEDKKRVLELCQHFEDGPLHVVTIHDDTVLHVATFSKQVDLVLELLERVSNSQLDKLTRKNEVGNTILHEACTSDKLVLAAKEMLIKAPELLYIRNAYGVTPLYRSVLYGKTDMFEFLVGEIEKRKNETEGYLETDREGYYQKTNKTTILHTAVTTESFDLALLIAQRNKHLVNEKDKDGMTALQLLACKSSTFESRGGGCSMHRMYSCVSTEDGSTGREATRKECRALQENETKEGDPFDLRAEIEDKATRKAYKAILQKEPNEVVLEQCKKFSDGPFHLLTIHKDTVLQVATSCKRADLVLELLKMVPNDQCHKLTDPNQGGNTILHEASTSNNLVLAAKEMLIKAPALLNMRNNFEVTPLFRSVVFGRMEVFKFLDKQIRKGKQTTDLQELERIHFYNKSKTNILHAAVTNGSFDLAFFIAKKYKYLVYDKDKDGMTALQLLACNPLAFESRGGGGCLKRLKCSRDSIKEMSFVSEDESTEDVTHKEAGRWRVPYWEKIQKKKKRHESALRLAKLLIKEDKSWKETEAMEDPDATKYYQHSQTSATPTETGQPSEKKEKKKIPEKPLILATRYGYVEMVKEILEVYPWAVEHVDYEGRTILHVAIKYRQIEVLDLVEGMGVLSRLERKVDKNFNTILHMVGEETTDRIVPELQAPAFELQENLLLFERVREICPRSLLNTINRQSMTAHQLFEGTNEILRGKANEWLKQTAENCSIVAVLIATVAFAAAYTIPGGSDQNGFPVFLNQPFFVVFTMTDVLSLTFALTSVIIFLRILTSPFHLKDFKQSLLQMLMLGITFLIASVTLMMMAFVATVLLMLQNQRDWTKVALYTASVLPVFIFTLSYMPLYLSLMTTFKNSFQKVKTIFCGYSKSKPEQIRTSNSTYPPKLRASPNLV